MAPVVSYFEKSVHWNFKKVIFTILKCYFSKFWKTDEKLRILDMFL